MSRNRKANKKVYHRTLIADTDKYLFGGRKRFQPTVNDERKVGRNESCPCGETKEKLNRFYKPYNVPIKYKHCCLNKR